jgi:N-acetyl-gamma-glutamyl-phosphate reductase
MNKKYNVVISGIQGYVGKALIALIHAHPQLQLFGVHGRQTQHDLYQLMPQLAKQNVPVYSILEMNQLASQIDILILATPAKASMEMVASLIATKMIMIDLSGAFRLPEDQFFEWYGFPHCAPELIKKACYGLSPWIIDQSHHQLIANPGCYATCVLMSLLPLLNADLIKTDSIIIDAKSGVSGSGKQLNADLMFCELSSNYFPYKIGKHQHTPEINKALYDIAGQTAKIRLTTSILPIERGIAMTIYTEAKSHLSSDKAIAQAVQEALQTAYGDYSLIHFEEVGAGSPTKDHFILSLKNVVQTPNTHIGYFIKNGQITLFSCIDNLLKGAASQAIENINAIYNLPLHTGLLPVMEAS